MKVKMIIGLSLCVSLFSLSAFSGRIEDEMAKWNEAYDRVVNDPVLLTVRSPINGDTLLHRAVRDYAQLHELKAFMLEIIRYLVDNGAEAMAENHAGETPLGMVDQNGNEELAQLLFEAAARAVELVRWDRVLVSPRRANQPVPVEEDSVGSSSGFRWDLVLVSPPRANWPARAPMSPRAARSLRF